MTSQSRQPTWRRAELSCSPTRFSRFHGHRLVRLTVAHGELAPSQGGDVPPVRGVDDVESVLDAVHELLDEHMAMRIGRVRRHRPLQVPARELEGGFQLCRVVHDVGAS